MLDGLNPVLSKYAPLRALMGKRKHQGEKSPRVAKRALVLREEPVLSSILDLGVGSDRVKGSDNSYTHEEPAAAEGAATRTLQQRISTPERSPTLRSRIEVRRAVGASAKALFPPQLPSGSAPKCWGERRGFDDTEPKPSRMDPHDHDPGPEVAVGGGGELKKCDLHESRGPGLSRAIMFVLTVWLLFFSGNPFRPASVLALEHEAREALALAVTLERDAVHGIITSTKRLSEDAAHGPEPSSIKRESNVQQQRLVNVEHGVRVMSELLASSRVGLLWLMDITKPLRKNSKTWVLSISKASKESMDMLVICDACRREHNTNIFARALPLSLSRSRSRSISQSRILSILRAHARARSAPPPKLTAPQLQATLREKAAQATPDPDANFTNYAGMLVL